MSCPGPISEVALRLYNSTVTFGNTVAIPYYLHACLIRVKLFLLAMARDVGDQLLYTMANFTATRMGSYVVIPQGVLEVLQFVAMAYRETK